MKLAKPIVKAVLSVLILVVPSSVMGADKASEVSQTTGGRSDRTVESLVQAALRAELDGDATRRTELLYDALDQSSNDPATNWQLGYIRSADGQWLSISQHQKLNALDATRIAYEAFRTRLGSDPNRDWTLGDWCTRNNMDDVAKVHYARVVAGNNYDAKTRQKAMRRLGLESYQGMLLTEEEIKRAKQSARDFKQACQRWEPRLKDWQQTVNAKTERSAGALDELLRAEDPQLVRVMELFLPQSGEPFGLALVMRDFEPGWQETSCEFRA